MYQKREYQKSVWYSEIEVSIGRSLKNAKGEKIKLKWLLGRLMGGRQTTNVLSPTRSTSWPSAEGKKPGLRCPLLMISYFILKESSIAGTVEVPISAKSWPPMNP